LVQKQLGVTLEKMDFLVDIVLICFEAMKESGLTWPLITEDEQDRQMARFVGTQGPLPGDWQRQEERIEPRVVEALANVPASGKQEPFLCGRDRRELLTHVAVGLGSHPSAQHDKMPRKRSKLAREVLEVVPALGQQDRGAPITRAPMTSLRIIALRVSSRASAP
jgi:hypothetical protein